MLSLDPLTGVWVQCGQCSEAASCVLSNRDPFATTPALKYFCARDLKSYLLGRPAYLEYLLGHLGAERLARILH
jgi:hypothetical protein